MLVDYEECVSRLAAALGRHYRDTPTILNLPGVSMALKIDPFYYLALRPAFATRLGIWAGMPPARVEETLARTGNMVVGPGRTRYDGLVAVFEEGTSRVARLQADFVSAGFIDRAVVMYGGGAAPAMSHVRLVADQRPALDAFFADMPPLQSLAFGEPGVR